MSAILEIEKEQDNYAKIIASKLNASINRKMGMIDILGITVFAKYLKKYNINPNLSNCLHKFPFALEEYKITDVNYNGHRIYVITVFRENYIRIPKMHFELGIEPDFYVITEVDKSIERGAIGGFIKASDVLSSVSDDRFYYPQKKDVLKIDGLINLIKTPAQAKQTYGRHLEASAMFVKLTDSELRRKEKNKLIRHLLTCENCTIKLKEVLQFDRVLSPQVNLSYNTEKLQTKAPKSIVSKVVKKTFAESAIKPVEIISEKGVEDTQNSLEILSKKLLNKKETIDFIFKGKNVFDINFAKINIKDLQTKKNILLTAGICVILLLCIVIGVGAKKASQTLEPIAGLENIAATEIDNEQDFYDQQDYYDSQGAVNLDYSLTHSSGAKPGVMSIKNVSWEVDKDIAGKDNYTKFLQIVGKNIKLNLQNELLVASDFARNDTIRADIKFSNNGKVGNLRLTQGSGSAQIDEIIQKCVYETLSYISPPASGFMGKNLEITLIIEL